jgi:hypothetical protein
VEPVREKRKIAGLPLASLPLAMAVTETWGEVAMDRYSRLVVEVA